jgi:hypothetical protein
MTVDLKWQNQVYNYLMGQGNFVAEIPLGNDYLKTSSLSLGHTMINNSWLKAKTLQH